MAALQVRQKRRMSTGKRLLLFQNHSRWKFKTRATERSLPAEEKSEITRAAAVTAALDMRPLSVCDGHACMRYFVHGIFKMGQSVLESEKIDPKSYLRGRTAVKNAVRDSL